ncbi:MAG: hypothetical protein H7Y36_00080 [Armatimonadetes bacterium]|nr:hypothetical protein [Akkermansiaceae bacterium]
MLASRRLAVMRFLPLLPSVTSSLPSPRMTLSKEFEAVTPDPKKLRRTALILLAIMVVGGVVILKAYEKRSKEAAKENRPNYVTRISEAKDLTFLRQDGEIKELIGLKGKVLVVQCLASAQPDELSTGVMHRISDKYKGREDVALLTLLIDPGPSNSLLDELKIMAENLGAKLPQWTVASNERPTLHRFIKNEFKASMLPHKEAGKWIYDGSIVLIDKERHVRRAVVPQKRGGAPYVTNFDFEQAKKWDVEGIKTGTDLSNTEQMEALLNQTIEILLK